MKFLNSVLAMLALQAGVTVTVTAAALEEQERRAMAIANGCKNEQCIDNVLAGRGFVNSPAPPPVMVDDADADEDVDVVTDEIGAFDIEDYEDEEEDEEGEHFYFIKLSRVSLSDV